MTSYKVVWALKIDGVAIDQRSYAIIQANSAREAEAIFQEQQPDAFIYSAYEGTQFNTECYPPGQKRPSVADFLLGI